MTANVSQPSIPTYVAVDRPGGFDVEDAHDIVRVRLRPTNWELERSIGIMAIPLHERGLVLSNLVLGLGRDRSGALAPLSGHDRAATESRWASTRKWQQLRKLLGPPVHRRLRRLLSTVDPLMLAIQRATRASYCTAEFSTEYYVGVLPDPAFIQDPHVRRDILTHRAAAIAAGHLTELVPAWLRRVVPDLADAPPSALDDPATRTAIVARHPLFASPAGLELLREWMGDRSLRMSAALVEAMRFWRDLFSWSGVSDERLERTLAHLPEDVADFQVCALPSIPLRRPLTDRLELLVTAFVARREDDRQRYNGAPNPNAEVLLDARRDEIVRAMHLVSTYFGWTLEPRYDGHVSTFVDFVLRYAETQGDSLVGLAEEAVAVDLRTLEWERSEVLATLGASTPSARPPIPLPDIPGIRFLATVQEIADVGVELRSNLALSARRAVEGDWYLFRVDHNGDKEAVWVGRDGWVVLSPYSDRRMTWGEKALEAWAAGFRPPPRPYVDDYDDDRPF
jgi:hypothetical protein